MTATGCPKCGSDRLKAAPILIVDSILNSIGSRRRYQCSACGWRGRRHRLRRRNSELPSLTQRTTPQRKAVWFSFFAVAFVLITGVLFMRSCNELPRPTIEGGGLP